MGGYKETDPEKEKKRQKALRRMAKILGKAWELPQAEHFHASNKHANLGAVGEKIDQEEYRYGRHGWEDFSKDIGGVYNRHIHGNTKYAKLAGDHLQAICGWLAEKDESLADAAKEYTPPVESKGSNKKRKHDDHGEEPPRSKTKPGAKTTNAGSSDDIGLTDREDRALQNLFTFVEENGGDRRSVINYTCRVTRKPSDGRYDANYYNEHGKRFRSMVEVAKFLNILTGPVRSAGGKKVAGMKKRKSTTTEIENEKKKLRKELEKLRRQHTKARKQLDDFLTDEKDARYPVEDMLLQEEDKANEKRVLPTNCPAARLPEIDGIPSIPAHCMPEVLAVWDFLSTFTRNLNLNPISLEDFIQCLAYKPPSNLSDSDALKAPPVFLGEAHLSLLKLILADRSSDEWWWSILETDVTENAVADHDVADVTGTDESALPLIKVDFAALLVEPEDPLITQSWLQNLEKIRNMSASNLGSIRKPVRDAMGVAANKWVLAYLRKSLKLGKTSGATFMKRAVLWLVDTFRAARPDLKSRSVNTKSVFETRARIVEDVTQQMDKLSSVALTVTDDDLASDIDDESDDDSDDSDDEEGELHNAKQESTLTREDPDERPASFIPKKPSPTLVDLLLPPNKPTPPSDLLNPASWPQIAGATAIRIIHRYRRLRNELDDSLRLIRELPRLTVKQRRERELMASKRVFSEFAESADDDDPPQRAANHLCSGGDYLDLTPLQRLCILRVLIDSAYDTYRVHEIIDTNHKQQTNAVKALNAEERRASKEAKEKAASAEAAAREDLANEAKRNFIEEKREEIRKINEASQAMTQDEIDELTEEDILDFDEDIRADFEALPAPESFKKVEVLARVEQIKEAAAFETDVLTVLTMPDLLKREKAELDDLKQTLQDLGGEGALMDPSLDRSVVRRIEKARRDVRRGEENVGSLPIQREAAIETLQEAIADGTIKSLRAAIRIAKVARLTGPDVYTNGVWALDLVRDAYMELENAKQLKRVADAQQDLITKLARCFTRTEPLGTDRFRNRLWRFENSEQCHIWAEVNPVLKEAGSDLTNQVGYLPVVSSIADVSIGAPDMEDDFNPKNASEIKKFLRFSRQEYDASGMTPALAKRHWGCHASESAVRALMKGLDGRGIRENELKKNLKEALEKATAAENSTTEELKGTTPEVAEEKKSGDAEEEDEEDTHDKALKTSGDEVVFAAAKAASLSMESDMVNKDMIASLSTGLGQRIRVRIPVDRSKEAETARYEDTTVTGWKTKKDHVPVLESDDDHEFDPEMKIVDTPIWYCTTGVGHEIWLTGHELLEAICRFIRKKNHDPTYFESDAAFLAYRNSLGRHCGKAAEAGQALTPLRFAQFMVRREAELYQLLKHIVYESSWGGRDGHRSAWATSMKDFAFEFETARDGLLTLENALFEITGGLPPATDDNEPSGKALLENPSTRDDIELESIEKGVKGLWNSRSSRAVFLEIVNSCKTVGFLVLSLELLVRNAMAYISANTAKGSGAATASSSLMEAEFTPYDLGTAPRSSRRSSAAAASGSSSAWHDDRSYAYYDDHPVSRPSRRAGRVNYAGLD